MAVTYTASTVTNPVGAQGSYPLDLTKGHEGMLADLQAYVSRSYNNQSGAALPFGRMLAIDNTPTSNSEYAVDLAGGATNIVGISVDSFTFEGVSGGNGAYVPNPTNLRTDANGDKYAGYPDKQVLNVMSKGVIWVYSATAIALGDDVRFFLSDESGTTAGQDKGRFTKTAAASKTVQVVTGARWLSESSAAGLALLELDIPSATFTADT
tara:strand:- start:2859 stop:3488 length:630 start_codon:yes stop_codon:yes gene_type:complete